MKKMSIIKNLIMLTVAGTVNAFAVTVFLSPVKLYDSGISGTSIFDNNIRCRTQGGRLYR